MENVAKDIPIYKIYHIRSPDITPVKNVEETLNVSEAPESELSPEYNVIYVFYGNVEFMTDEGNVVNINIFSRKFIPLHSKSSNIMMIFNRLN